MEFIKVGKKYMIKNGNGRMITEQEKIELENKELIIKDIQSNECQAKTTQKLTKNKKRLKIRCQYIDNNGLYHNFDCDFSGDPAFNHSLTQNTNQEKDLFSKSSKNITFRPDLNIPLPDSSPQKGEEHV